MEAVPTLPGFCTASILFNLQYKTSGYFDINQPHSQLPAKFYSHFSCPNLGVATFSQNRRSLSGMK